MTDRPFLRHKPIAIALALAKVVLAFIGLIVAAGLLAALLRRALSDFVPEYALTNFELLTRSIVLIAFAAATKSLSVVGLKRPVNWRDAGELLAVVVWVIGFVAVVSGIGRNSIGDSLTVRFVFFMVLMATLTGLWEELFFRGFVLRFMGPCGLLGSLVMSSLVFGAAHLRPSTDILTLVANVVPTFSLGLLFAINRLRTGSIWPSVLAHGAIDAFHFLLVGDSREAASRQTDPASFLLYLLLALPILTYCYFAIRRNHAEWIVRYAGVYDLEY